MKMFHAIAFTMLFALSACAHSEARTSESSAGEAKAQTKESRTSAAVRKRAAFDLGCPGEQIQVAQIEGGTLLHPATYGATCGDKRASYLERMGTIIKQ